jgi:hypothetical protein
VSASAPLSDGTHAITVEATDVDGDTATWEITGLMVRSAGAATVSGIPLNYPNPFDPAAGTMISYYLTKGTNISINIFDITGNVIVKKDYGPGVQGGMAGYNEVAWDGKSGNGEYIGNGIYLYLIIGDGRVLAKGKLTAFRR